MPVEKILNRVAPAEQPLNQRVTAPPPPPNFAGLWRNQLQSEMNLAVSGSRITGHYTSLVSSTGQKMTGELAGHINGDLIAFTVNWPTAAITAWAGQVVTENSKNLIRTLWQMTTNIEEKDEPTGLWHSIYAGSDTFWR